MLGFLVIVLLETSCFESRGCVTSPQLQNSSRNGKNRQHEGRKGTFLAFTGHSHELHGQDEIMQLPRNKSK